MVSPKFYRNWKAPTVKQIEQMYPKLNAELVHLATAAASHQIMMEDPTEYIDFDKYEDDGVVLKDFIHLLDKMDGDPFEKGVKFAAIVQEKARNYAYHKTASPDYARAMQAMAEEAAEAPGSGPKKEDKIRDAAWMSGDKQGVWNEFKPRTSIVEALAKFDLLQKYMDYKTPELTKGKPPEEYDVRVCRRISDLRFASRLELALPKEMFWEKYAKGSIMCKVPMAPVQKVLEIVVLLDDSGSMNDYYKVEWVVGILGVLFDAVIAGQAVVYFASFCYYRSAFVKIDTEEIVLKFQEHFRSGSQGTTFLDRILPELADDLKKGQLDEFELSNVMDILIINDGQDDVPKDLILGVPCHAISVEERNNDLKQMCNNNGGNYYQASASGDIQLL